jgi:hypothetical protein
VQGDTHAFIVRIWHEELDSEGNGLAWRGSIQHVGSSKRLYFQDLEGIVHFVREETGINARYPKHKWHALLDRIRRGST